MTPNAEVHGEYQQVTICHWGRMTAETDKFDGRAAGGTSWNRLHGLFSQGKDNGRRRRYHRSFQAALGALRKKNSCCSGWSAFPTSTHSSSMDCAKVITCKEDDHRTYGRNAYPLRHGRRQNGQAFRVGAAHFAKRGVMLSAFWSCHSFLCVAEIW